MRVRIADLRAGQDLIAAAAALLHETFRGRIGGSRLRARVFQNLKGHPCEFYVRIGFTIVGVMPEANGPGKPDIVLAKRVRHAPIRPA